jgi:hypothetical protein
MSTKLSTPIVQAAIVDQGITRFEVQIPHKRNLAGDAAEIDKQGIRVRYEVTTWDEAGKVAGRESRAAPFGSWPAGLKTDVQAVYARLVANAKTGGLIGPGTDETI